MLFSEVVGHAQAKTILQNALAGQRAAHAYLFNGPAGVGKTTLAAALAAALLCGHGVTEACGSCPICRKFAGQNCPDFFELVPAGNNIKIEQVRELQKKARFKPYEAAAKVYIINQAETMTVEAANCLLKILEDPPVNTVFLLTAVNQYRLLPTIISRCQLVPLTRVSQEEIGEMLIKKYGVDREKAAVLASLCDGLPGVAVQMAASGKGLDIRESVFQLAEQISNENASQLLKAAEDFEKKKELLPEILEQLLLWYRDQLIWLQTGEENLVVNIDKLVHLKNSTGKLSRDQLIRSITNIIEAKNHIGRNVNARLVMEVLLLRLARIA